MEELLRSMIPADAKSEAKKYIEQKEIGLLFECILAGLLHHRPSDPPQFVQDCLEMNNRRTTPLRWDIFIECDPSTAKAHYTSQSKDSPGEDDPPFIFGEDPSSS